MLSRPKRSGFAEKRSSSLDRGDKMLVNLEDVVLEEDKIWTILEVLYINIYIHIHTHTHTHTYIYIYILKYIVALGWKRSGETL